MKHDTLQELEAYMVQEFLFARHYPMHQQNEQTKEFRTTAVVPLERERKKEREKKKYFFTSLSSKHRI